MDHMGGHNGDDTNGPSPRTPRREDKPRVLLADDNDDLRSFLSSSLHADGYQVFEARDGSELLRLVAGWMFYRWPEEPIDVILSDVRMPGYSGTDVVSELRKARCRTPVILMSAYVDQSIRDEAARLDAVAVLSKPFDLDALRTAVRYVVTGARDDGTAPLWWRREHVFVSLAREFARRHARSR